MAQTPALRRAEGDHVDYTPAGAVNAGDVIVLNGRVHVAEHAIDASAKGAIAKTGIFKFPKDTSVFVKDGPSFWNPTGTPVTGTASSGAMSNASGVGYAFAGYVTANAATGDSYVESRLPPGDQNSGSRNVAATGSVIANAALLDAGSNWVTAADGTKGVQLPTPILNQNTVVFVKNDDTANAILKVYPHASGTINAIAANSAISMAAKTAAIFIYTPTGWATIPLLPS